MKFLILSIFFIQNLFAIDIVHSKKSHSIAYEMLEDARLYNSHVYSDYDLLFQLHFNTVQDPLVRKTQSNLKQVDTIVSNLSSVHLGGAVYLSKNLLVGLQTYYGFLEYEYFTPGSAINSTKLEGSTSAFSDIILDLKWRFLSKERYSLALMPFLRIPTGSGEIPVRIFSPSSSNFQDISHKVLSEDSWGLGGRFIFEKYFDFMNLVINLGYQHADKAILGELDLRSKISLGVGGYIPLSSKVGVNLEWLRYFSLPLNSNQNPNELFVGLSAGITKRVVVFGGAALGNFLTDDDGNDFRISAGVKFSPRIWSEEKLPIELINPEPVFNEVEKQCTTPYVFEKSNRVIVRFPNNIGTILDSRDLDQVIKRIKDRAVDIFKVEIIGHTSQVGSESYNQKLSEQRASSVKRVLVDHGIDQYLISSSGKGELELIDPSLSEMADEVNRRVEFIISLKQKDGYYCQD